MSVGLILCLPDKVTTFFCCCHLKLFRGPLAQKQKRPNNLFTDVKQIKTKKRPGGSFFREARRKKAWSPPRLSILQPIVSLQKKTAQGKGKKEDNRSVRRHLLPSTPTFSSSYHVELMEEDPLPKSKRRHRMERIWAQDNSNSTQAAMMEVKSCSPLRSTAFLLLLTLRSNPQ